jgi:hypothetical protein
VLPSLMTLPGAMLVGISTPHKKPGTAVRGNGASPVPAQIITKTKNGSRSSGTGVTAPYLAARPAA